MDRPNPGQNEELSLDHKTGKLPGSEDFMSVVNQEQRHLPQPHRSDSQRGPERIADNESQWMPWNSLLSQFQQQALIQRSAMTVAEFVERKFVPEHVASKELSGRTHYQAMLKHVLTPAEVDRIFGVSSTRPGKKLKAVPDWPYLSGLRLCDVRPEHVQRLTAAALDHGYSTQTVVHLRNVVSAVFSHAKREGCFLGDNPVVSVKTPEITRGELGILTADQLKDALAIMKHPERDMMLTVVLTDMNVSEICGLQWKRVNLSDLDLIVDGERIPPRTIAVRKQWYRGKLGSVKDNRVRNLPIPKPLLPVLNAVRSSSRFIAGDDFVYVSRAGTPVNETNIRMHMLPPIARRLGISRLSWRVFLRTRKALASQLELQAQNSIAHLVGSTSHRNADGQRKWRCRGRGASAHS